MLVYPNVLDYVHHASCVFNVVFPELPCEIYSHCTRFKNAAKSPPSDVKMVAFPSYLIQYHLNLGRYIDILTPCVQCLWCLNFTNCLFKDQLLGLFN